MLTRATLQLCCLTGLSLAAQVTNISLPPHPSPRVLLSDVYGYSMEPVWVSDFVASNLTANLMASIASVIGKPPQYRIGGTTADETYYHSNQTPASIASPSIAQLKTFNVSSEWYDSWADYFPAGTTFIYTLNFADMSRAWSTALAEAAAVWSALGDRLKLLELGNEVDHYISEHWRPTGWDVAEYIPQWRNLTDDIMSTPWYQAASSPPKFQAAVFADPPEVPDQQAEIDDFDIVNLTRGGLIDPAVISTYSVHLYPQSTCDTARWYRMSLNLLSNHSVVWANVSQYIPQVAAADAAQSPLVLGETNSVSCGGRSGISDTFAAALWSVDYVLLAASIGIEKLYFHLGAQSEYASFVPLPYTYKGESLAAGVRALFYGHYFLAHVVGDSSNSNSSGGAQQQQQQNLTVAAIPAANSSDLSGYAIYNATTAAAALRKLVFLDLAVWNSSQGLHNPSTLSATDSTAVSPGARPARSLRVDTPWARGAQVKVTRLNGPGSNAKSLVNVSGVAFDPATGARVGTEVSETLVVGRKGLVSFDLQQAQGILLEI